MANATVILELFSRHLLLESREVEEQGQACLKQLESLVSLGSVGCKVVRTPAGSESRVYWLKRNADTHSSPGRAATVTSSSTPRSIQKRSHPKFVSPLLSQKPLKKARVTPTPGKDGSTHIASEEDESANELMKEKRMLEEQLKEREERLRKLKMVKLYRTKNDLEELEAIIKKWRQASQDAAETLLASSTREPHPTMAQLLDYLHIDPTLIHYSLDDEAFY